MHLKCLTGSSQFWQWKLLRNPYTLWDSALHIKIKFKDLFSLGKYKNKESEGEEMHVSGWFLPFQRLPRGVSPEIFSENSN